MVPGVTFRDYWCFLLDLVLWRRARAEWHTAMADEARWRTVASSSGNLTILDLGSGRLRPQAEIRSRQGHRYIGVDLANTATWSVSELFYILARFLYNFSLSFVMPKPVEGAEAPLLVCGSVDLLPLCSGSVDIVSSSAAFEHFLNVPGTLEEAHRVLKPGGVLLIHVHHFSSFSGGHCIGRILGPITQLPMGAAPWDHLLGVRTTFDVPLNRWRPLQYIQACEKIFEAVSVEFQGKEGEEYLTPETRDALREYSHQELTSPVLTILARKS